MAFVSNIRVELSACVIVLTITFGIFTYGFTSQFGETYAQKDINNSTFKVIDHNATVLFVRPDCSICLVPAFIAIPRGSTVTWINNDVTLHTVMSGAVGDEHKGEDYDSGYIAPGNSFHHLFNSSGVFNYHDYLHPFIQGKVRVN
jgi:plastocyanin